MIVLPNPRDALILQVLSDSLWTALSKQAPSDKAFYAPKDHAFLKMKKGLEDEYGPIAEWLKFQKEILGFQKNFNFVVVTDIANYYDWIRYTGLRAVLSELVETKEIVLDILIFVLRSMIWQPDYMANYEVGLPQCDLDAPRLLAHTMLFEIDGLLKDYPAVEFARYMDDIDIGVNSVAEGKQVLRDLDLTLQSRHLRLNSGKTLILPAKQAAIHFCVAENAILDLWEKRIAARAKAGADISHLKRLLPWWMARWNTEDRFEKGNGLKILKRLVNYSRVYNVSIDPEFFLFAFTTWSGIREALLRYLGRSVDPEVYLQRLTSALLTGEIVDDATVIRIAVAMASARYTRRLPPGTIEALMDSMDSARPFHVLACMWLASRFQTYREVRILLDKFSHIWSKEPIAIRSVAGFYPLFRGHRDITAVRARLTRIGGRAATQVFDFYDTHIFQKDGFKKISKFIGAKNQSFINEITHSKFLMLYGYLSNTDYTKAEKAAFLLKHVRARQDFYYRELIDTKLNSMP